jgi:hypothetical protein
MPTDKSEARKASDEDKDRKALVDSEARKAKVDSEAHKASDKTEARKASDKLETVTVETRDESDSTVDSVTRLIAAQGGTLKSQKGRVFKAEVPRGTDRDPTTAVSRFVEHLRNDPLVLSVDYD